MWPKFKDVATIVSETFHLLLLTVLLGQTLHVQRHLHPRNVMAYATTATTRAESSWPASPLPADGQSARTFGPASLTSAMPSEAAWEAAFSPASPTLAQWMAVTQRRGPPPSQTAATTTTTPLTSATTALRMRPSDELADSNEIDPLSDDSGDHEQDLLLAGDYVMTKHIALPDDSTRSETMTTSAMSSILLRQQGGQPALYAAAPSAPAPPAAAAGQQQRHRSTMAMPRAATRTTTTAMPLASLLNHGFPAERTRLDELSAMSLLSLNHSSADVKRSTFPPSPAGEAESAATPLRVKESERSMHHTSSHLAVDSVNATIVAGGEAAARQPPASAMSSSGSPSSSAHQPNATGRTGSSASSPTTSTLGSHNNSHAHAAAPPHGRVNATGTGTGTTRISARRVEHKYILPKSHKTDAPMLNYIFDTFSSANKHHHHDQRYGPHFEDVQLVGKPTNMTVQAGSSIHLNCRISLLQDKTVSWVRRNAEGENALDLLTVGLHAYTGDKRYKMEFQYPNNWRLKISNVKKDDEATYECQISTHPPRVIQINLHVNAPKVMIVDEFGDPLQEKYYEQDSTLQLSCVVRNVAMSSSVVFWKHSEDVLNYDVTRGGISVKTELMDDGANSTLFIAKINKADSGNYTCSISEYQNYTIAVHILNGESFAELHHGNAICWHRPSPQALAINVIVLATILWILPAHQLRR